MRHPYGVGEPVRETKRLEIMKEKTALTFTKAITLGIITELFLVALQFVYLKLYAATDPEAPTTFSTAYMMTRGFYIFQIIGFFVYVVTVYLINNRFTIPKLTLLLTYVVTGGIMELVFYLSIQADYQFAFLYSILDKFIAGVFGYIVYRYTTGHESTA